MVALVTLQEASDHLRRDTDDDDNDLLLKIEAASNAIMNYVKDPLLVYELAMDEWGVPLLDTAGETYLNVDSNGDYTVRREVKQAVLILLGTFYIDRDAAEYVNPRSGGGLERLGNMSLPRSVHWILDGLGRKPTLE